MPADDTRRFLGITVMADFILNEGVAGILDNITRRAGATAVGLNPTVTAPSAAGVGSFQPPADAGSSPRLFDRPLWGKRALWVQSGPSYRPNQAHYAASPYPSRQPNHLTDAHGALIGQFIDAALERGLKVYLQVAATGPSQLDRQDIPRLPDGRLPANRMANTGSLASAAIRHYNRAYIADLLEHYPQITGFRPDWPEYPCYKLDEAFQDFGPHVAAWAAENGFDFAAIRQEVGALYNYLHGSLKNEDLEDWASADRGKLAQLTLLRRYPGVLQWLQLKAALSVDLLRHWREIISAGGGAEKELSANAFMPPYVLFTGFDFAAAAAHCNAIAPKLYTMHWSVIIEFWGSVLLKHNPDLDEKLLVRALAHLFDLDDEVSASRIADYGYPEPHEPHPIPNAPQARKIRQVLAQAKDLTSITPIIHGYGPADDFMRRFKVVAASPAAGAWVNRYGYLSDEKLDAIGDLWH